MHHIMYEFTTTKDGNIAYHVGDIPKNVDENRKKLAKKFNFDISKLIYMNQVHGNEVKVVDENSPNLIDNCDGIITNTKGLTLMVMVADCIPIIFMDKVKGVVAAVHAGRNSTFLKIAELTALKMIKEFGCKEKDIEVVFGPSIQKCCYEVNEELEEIVVKNFGKEFVNDKKIDLQGINSKLLKNIDITNIKISNICTKCSQEPYFSYRLDNKTGRFCGVVKII